MILTSEELADRLERAAREAADPVYAERNQCVALIARLALALGYRVGLARTPIEGWDLAWQGCVYVELPQPDGTLAQVSWHFHDRERPLFDGLPVYSRPWDGHDTAEKYRRVLACRPESPEADTAFMAHLAERMARLAGLAEDLKRAASQLGAVAPVGALPALDLAGALDDSSRRTAPTNSEGAEMLT